ncbi:uncharacterized protein PV09_07592 [Verruconis gallopava]|uniref:Zn(2)-C6 fungal-type domain-containing protein n=1 Tax=Verruconis gallopava TaxID=253628 RepID=A0A0D1YIX7_9PEZI|nr:uncharacterized protein PV09_07592 [Verruconis gallopava]KIW00832.1 hypothetical protein PV09_07592 [Verruconis gallopava]
MTHSQRNATQTKAVKQASGRNAPKVKTACRTCKVRKVKCDEARPACNRCIKSGRSCEGYGIWGGGTSSVAAQITQSISPHCTDNVRPKVRISRKESNSYVKTFQPNPGPLKLPGTESSSTRTAQEELSQIVQARRVQDFSNQLPTTKGYECIFYSIPPVIPMVSRLEEESNLMSWFQEITSRKLTGAFLSEFWTSFLLQVCYSEPPVWHGVLALTSAHKKELLQLPGVAPVDELFTLKAYSKAIRCLEPHFHDQTVSSRRVTLITCILFVCLELIQKHYAAAVSHLSSGLKLIEQFEHDLDGDGFRAVVNDYTSQLIYEAFLKLSLQVALLGYRNFDPGFILNRRIASETRPKFLSIEEAKELLDKLLFRALEIGNVSRKEHLSQQAQAALLCEKKALQTEINSWWEAFNVYVVDKISSLPPKSKAGVIILRMYYAMAIIITEACQYPHLETVYDALTPQFFAIMEYATKMWTIVAGWHAQLGINQFPGDERGSIIDIGWIPAVYYTAIKCRVRRLRLYAIQLLEATLHTEGIWDATVAASVAREVMRIEDGTEQELCVNEVYQVVCMPSQEEISPPTLPESQRVHGVEVAYSGEGNLSVEVTCRRRWENGNWEEIHRTYNPKMRVWTDQTH